MMTYIEIAAAEAERFCKDQGSNLSIMTIRKAFELGYRFGYTDACHKHESETERNYSNRHQALTANAKLAKQSPDRDF